MSTSTNSLDSQTTSVSASGTTSSGTSIITSSESGGTMDKQAFLKILAAELSNLDPTQDQDSTQYVTQMAQFASIEQMDNLNTTLTKSSYNDLVGKGVVMTDTDSSGSNYAGIVKAVYTDSSNNTTIQLEITSSDGSTTTTKTFSADDIEAVTDSSSSTTNAIATTSLNTSFLAASALKGQEATVSTTDSSGSSTEVSGTIESAYIENGEVMVNITSSDGTTEEYPYSSIVKTSNSTSTTTSTTSA